MNQSDRDALALQTASYSGIDAVENPKFPLRFGRIRQAEREVLAYPVSSIITTAGTPWSRLTTIQKAENGKTWVHYELKLQLWKFKSPPKK